MINVIRHFYHLYLDGDAAWQPIAEEYAAVIELASFPEPPCVGLVGKDRGKAKKWLAGKGWPVVTEAETGFEQVTLAMLQDELTTMPDDTPVLYTHAKGAWRNISLEDQWRRSMLWHLLVGWRNCVALLEINEVVGCHWQGTFFAGNFWWARAGYLRTLSPVGEAYTETDRYRAETWLGEEHPLRVANLAEGFPPTGTEEGARRLSECGVRAFRLPYRSLPAEQAEVAGDPADYRFPGVSSMFGR